MTRRVILVVWTLAIWGSRIRNIVADEEVAGGERALALGVAGALLLAAVATAFALRLRASWQGPALLALVVLGIARWTLRGPMILFGDEWDTSFKVVHTILWLVTVVLSVLAWREHQAARRS
jgi:hypothetical protein